MSFYSFKEYVPNVDSSCYIAPGAMIIGRVEIGQDSSVWHNCVLRGDVNTIKIGSRSNIQDLSMLHITESNPLLIGDNVTIGHSVTLHGCTIENNVLVGMGATVLDKVIIGEYCIVAAGSVVPPGKVFPPKSMIMGSPAKVTRELSDIEIDMLNKHFKNYIRYAKDFQDPSIVRALN